MRRPALLGSLTNLASDTIGAATGHVDRRDRLGGAFERMTEFNGAPFGGKLAIGIASNADGSAVAFQNSDPAILPGDPARRSCPAILPGDAAASVDVFLRSVPRPVAGIWMATASSGRMTSRYDLAILLGDWGGTRADLDGDGAVGAADVAIVPAHRS